MELVKVPTECAARMRFIADTSARLAALFRVGSKSFVRSELERLPFSVALAVVASMSEEAGATALAAYLREVA